MKHIKKVFRPRFWIKLVLLYGSLCSLCFFGATSFLSQSYQHPHWFFATLPISWDVSPEQNILFYDPLWPCDNRHPPFMILDAADDVPHPPKGQLTRVFQSTYDLNSSEHRDFGRFFRCRGQFKTVLGVLVWEHIILRNDPYATPTGKVFDAILCQKISPTPEQQELAALYERKFYGEPREGFSIVATEDKQLP